MKDQYSRLRSDSEPSVWPIKNFEWHWISFGSPQYRGSWTQSSSQYHSFQDGWLLSLRMTWIIIISVHYSSCDVIGYPRLRWVRMSALTNIGYNAHEKFVRSLMEEHLPKHNRETVLLLCTWHFRRNQDEQMTITSLYEWRQFMNDSTRHKIRSIGSSNRTRNWRVGDPRQEPSTEHCHRGRWTKTNVLNLIWRPHIFLLMETYVEQKRKIQLRPASPADLMSMWPEILTRSKKDNLGKWLVCRRKVLTSLRNICSWSCFLKLFFEIIFRKKEYLYTPPKKFVLTYLLHILARKKDKHDKLEIPTRILAH